MHTKCQGVSRSNTILAWIIEWFTLGKDSFHTNAYTNQKSNNIKVQTVKNDNCRTSTMTSWGLQLTPIHVIWRNWHAQIASWHGFKGCFNHGFPATFFEYTGSLLRGIGVNNETHHLSIVISRSKECTLDLLYLVLLLLTAASAQGRTVGWLLCLPSVLIYWPVSRSHQDEYGLSRRFVPRNEKAQKSRSDVHSCTEDDSAAGPTADFLMMFFAHPNRIGNPKSWSCASKMSPIRLRFWAR